MFLKFDIATGVFLKFNRATLPFLMIDMRHRDPPSTPSGGTGPLLGGVDGGSRCRMSIIRNANVALSNLRKAPVTLSILRKAPVALSNLRKAPVACH